MLKVTCKERQSNRANGHLRKRCCIVSSSSQKQHLLLPAHRRFAKLSLVKMTPLWTNHMNTLIFKGTFTFQIFRGLGIVSVLIKSIYIDLSEKKNPEEVSFQITLSG